MFLDEAMAQALEKSADYKVLRRLKANPRRLSNYDGPTLMALLVDVETTGFDPVGRDGPPDEVIEFAALPISYLHDGTIIEIHSPVCALREPMKPIPPAITKLTGLTADMVRGRTIHPDQIAHLLSGVNLVVAHNARFDRPFCEALHPDFSMVQWGCSMAQIPWATHGHEGTKLPYLLAAHGLFHDRHRGEDDVLALAEILLRPLGESGRTAFAFLIEEAFEAAVRIYANGAPFAKKDQLRSRSYRWSPGENGQPRAWYIDLPASSLSQELAFLCGSILPPGVEPLVRRIDGFDRFSDRC